jgi:hypothetical protein
MENSERLSFFSRNATIYCVIPMVPKKRTTHLRLYFHVSYTKQITVSYTFGLKRDSMLLLINLI